MQQGQAPTLGVAVLTSKQAEAVLPLATAVAALTAEALQAKVGLSCRYELLEQWQDASAAGPPVLHVCTCARQLACCQRSGCQLLTKHIYIYKHLAAHAGQASAGI